MIDPRHSKAVAVNVAVTYRVTAILGSIAGGKQGTDSGNPAKSAGYPYQSPVCRVGQLLFLGLNHVGFTSSMPTADRKALTQKLEALIEAPGT